MCSLSCATNGGGKAGKESKVYVLSGKTGVLTGLCGCWPDPGDPTPYYDYFTLDQPAPEYCRLRLWLADDSHVADYLCGL